MSGKQILYAALGYFGWVWVIALVTDKQPFDALVLAVMSLIVIHESYKENTPNE